ncbi:MAG: LON peptidase substrate-binding domain-containing protein [Burkholderiales bacterium]
MSDVGAIDTLPLFPLRSVLFPGGLLQLKIFEARYLDLMAQCLRTREPFGVVALTHGGEVRNATEAVHFEPVGVLAELIDCDSPGAGLMQVRCRGLQRFHCTADAVTHADGLWVAPAQQLPGDPPMVPAQDHASTVAALQRAIDTLDAQGNHPFLPPWQLDDAGWVANRWCELLPISVTARQKLMELDDPLMRLTLVHEFLQQHEVVKD